MDRPVRRARAGINYNEDETTQPSEGLELSRTNTTSVSRRYKTVCLDDHCQYMFKKLHKLQQEGTHCDAALHVKEGVVKVHKLVLLMASPQLKNFVRSSRRDSKMAVIALNEIPFWAVQKIVSFLYTGVLEVLETDVPSILTYCRFLGLSELCNNLESSTVIQIKTEVVPQESYAANDEASKSSSKRARTAPVAEFFSHPSRGKRQKTSKTVDAKSKRGLNPNNNTPKRRKRKIKEDDSESFTDEDQDAGFDSEKTESDNNNEGEDGGIELDSEKTESDNNNDSESTLTADEDTETFIVKSGLADYELPVRGNSAQRKDILGFFECERCHKVFQHEKKFKAHKSYCNMDPPRRKCHLCRQVFETTKDYEAHRKTDNLCLGMQQAKHSYMLEKNKEYRRKYACRVCPRKFRNLAYQVEHEFVKHEMFYDKKAWPDQNCEFCKYTTINPLRLRSHELYSCNQGKDFICDQCGDKLRNASTLKTHKELKHGDIEKRLKTCEECGKQLCGDASLKKHILVMHRGVISGRSKICHMCSSRYRNTDDLTIHLHKVHDQPLPDDCVIFNCSLCDYYTNNKRRFGQHEILHTDSRNFACELCSKAFKTNHGLKSHQKLHFGTRKVCPYEGCDYKTILGNSLKAHIANQHTQKGAKNEYCHLCTYSTFFKGNLIKHLRNKHKLQVVTKHSVSMREKYKNLKSGDILGIAEDSAAGKKKKTSGRDNDTTTTPAGNSSKQHRNSGDMDMQNSAAGAENVQHQLSDSLNHMENAQNMETTTMETSRMETSHIETSHMATSRMENSRMNHTHIESAHNMFQNPPHAHSHMDNKPDLSQHYKRQISQHQTEQGMVGHSLPPEHMLPYTDSGAPVAHSQVAQPAPGMANASNMQALYTMQQSMAQAGINMFPRDVPLSPPNIQRRDSKHGSAPLQFNDRAPRVNVPMSASGSMDEQSVKTIPYFHM